ncbi:MAG: protein kinase [Planctomycetes bacterium]|nr:protein kinase [Planctomycetota bacterium]
MEILGVISGVLTLFEVAKKVVEQLRKKPKREQDGEILTRFSRLESRMKGLERVLASSRGAESGSAGEAVVEDFARTGRLLPELTESLADLDEIRRRTTEAGLAGSRDLEETLLDLSAREPDLGRWIEEARTLHLGAEKRAPVAFVYVLSGRATPRRLALLDGMEATVGTARDCDIVFEDGSLAARHCRLVVRGDRVSLEALTDRALRVGKEEVSFATLGHAEVVLLSPASAIQVALPSHRDAGGETERVMRAQEATDDSQAALLAQTSCAGECGTALGPADVAEERAVDASGGLWCLSCLAQGRGPFRTVDDYRLVKRLGQGGMGEVYLAVQNSLGRLVAVKVLREKTAEDADAIVRFCREAKTGGMLQHPNIIGFIGTGRVEGVHYIVMEYARGKTVRELLQKGRLKLIQAAKIAYQVTKALSHALAKDIVHRDIKPENILLDRMKTVRLLDFGMAKRMATAGSSGVTAAGTAMGTLYYMAPEQIEDACFADHRSDIYSLGVTLYEMATGVRPFTGRSESTIVAAILAGERAAAASIVPEAPASLDAIVARATALSPGSRYQTPDEMGADLKELYRSLEP